MSNDDWTKIDGRESWPPFGYDVIVSTQERRVAISTLIGFDGVSPRWELYENGEHLICPLDYIVAWQPILAPYEEAQ